MKEVNRIKVVLAEKKRTSKWLAEQIGKNPKVFFEKVLKKIF